MLGVQSSRVGKNVGNFVHKVVRGSPGLIVNVRPAYLDSDGLQINENERLYLFFQNREILYDATYISMVGQK